jgi:hypothetical protein
MTELLLSGADPNFQTEEPGGGGECDGADCGGGTTDAAWGSVALVAVRY